MVSVAVVINILLAQILPFIPVAHGWETDEDATSLCVNNEAAIDVSFTNQESSRGINVLATDLQSGRSVDLGTVAPGDTATGRILTGMQVMAAGQVRFDLTWASGHGSDVRFADYETRDCTPPPAPECTLKVSILEGVRRVSATATWQNGHEDWHILKWGDGSEVGFFGSSGDETREHVYADPDSYHIKFTVNGPGGTTVCKEVVTFEEELPPPEPEPEEPEEPAPPPERLGCPEGSANIGGFLFVDSTGDKPNGYPVFLVHHSQPLPGEADTTNGPGGFFFGCDPYGEYAMRIHIVNWVTGEVRIVQTEFFSNPISPDDNDGAVRYYLNPENGLPGLIIHLEDPVLSQPFDWNNPGAGGLLRIEHAW